MARVLERKGRRSIRRELELGGLFPGIHSTVVIK